MKLLSKKQLLQAANYGFNPQIGRRLVNMKPGFHYLAFLLAQVFVTIRVLPRTHHFIRPEYYGTYNLMAVCAAGANAVKWDWKHRDQWLFYTLIMSGIGLIFLRFVVGLLSLIMGQAEAIGMFETNPPDHDIAFEILDQVFGIPGFFGSIHDPVNLGYIPPFQEAFHALILFYNTSIIWVGVIIILYFLFVFAVESMQTGVPFGERTQTYLFAIRLVTAMLLLLPVAHGFSIGQYVVLQFGKWGSSVATNGWKAFNYGLTNSLGITPANMVGIPTAPDVTGMVEFMTYVKSCQAAYDLAYDPQNNSSGENITIEAFIVGPNGFAPFTGAPTYTQAVKFGAYRQVSFMFGERDLDKHGKLAHGIKPYCGALAMQVESHTNPLANEIYTRYYALVFDLWNDGILTDVGRDIAEQTLTNDVTVAEQFDINLAVVSIGLVQMDTQIAFDRALSDSLSMPNVNALLLSEYEYDTDLLNRGWGGAGLWFNKIADINGVIVSSMFNVPQPVYPPNVMMQIIKAKNILNDLFRTEEYYKPVSSKGDPLEFNDVFDAEIANVLYTTSRIFNADDIFEKDKGAESNFIGQAMALIFGAEGLFDLRNNAEVHPLAQMTSLGRSIVDSSIKNLGIGVSLNIGAGPLDGSLKLEGLIGGGDKSTVSKFAGLFFTISTIALSVGFLLYYILPFLPFMYFLFAAINWVRSIFEAIVAVPLWALAHLRVDAGGLFGPGAANGYMLILEIFVRPILIVFGMIAAIASFSALASVLNEIFDLVTGNLTGQQNVTPGGAPSDPTTIAYYRSSVDQFFYTLAYAIIVYVLALSCFKMIDLVPNAILRWINSSVKAYAEGIQDNTQTLIQYGALGSSQLGGNLVDGIKGMSEDVSTAGKDIASKMRDEIDDDPTPPEQPEQAGQAGQAEQSPEIQQSPQPDQKRQPQPADALGEGLSSDVYRDRFASGGSTTPEETPELKAFLDLKGEEYSLDKDGNIETTSISSDIKQEFLEGRADRNKGLNDD